MPSGTNFSLFMLLACGRGASRPPEFIFCSTLVGITLVHSLTGTPWRCLRNCWRIPLRGTCCFRPYYDFLLHFVCQICAWFFLESSARRGAAFYAAAAGLWIAFLWTAHLCFDFGFHLTRGLCLWFWFCRFWLSKSFCRPGRLSSCRARISVAALLLWSAAAHCSAMGCGLSSGLLRFLALL